MTNNPAVTIAVALLGSSVLAVLIDWLRNRKKVPLETRQLDLANQSIWLEDARKQNADLWKRIADLQDEVKELRAESRLKDKRIDELEGRERRMFETMATLQGDNSTIKELLREMRTYGTGPTQ